MPVTSPKTACGEHESNRFVYSEIVKGVANKWYDNVHEMPLVAMSELSAGQCMAACSSRNPYTELSEVDSECENGLVTGADTQSEMSTAGVTLPSVSTAACHKPVIATTRACDPLVLTCINEWFDTLLKVNKIGLVKKFETPPPQCLISQQQIDIVDQWIETRRHIDIVCIEAGARVSTPFKMIICELLPLLALVHLEIGHGKTDKMVAKIERSHNIQHLRLLCDYVCKSCATCATGAVPGGYHAVRNCHKANACNQTIHLDSLDFCVKCVLSDPQYKDKQYIQVRVDGHSKLVNATIVPNLLSRTAWNVFNADHIQKYGKPLTVVTDEGPEFQGEFTLGLRKNVIERVMTGTGASWSNGYAEKANSKILFVMRALMLDNNEMPNQMLPYLHHAIDAINKSPNKSTGMSPYEVVYGHPPPSAIQRALYQYSAPPQPISERRAFAVGEKVMFLLPKWRFARNGSTGMKLQGKWMPYIIVKRMSDSCYYIKPFGDKTRMQYTLAHTDHLMKCAHNSSIVGDVLNTRANVHALAPICPVPKAREAPIPQTSPVHNANEPGVRMMPIHGVIGDVAHDVAHHDNAAQARHGDDSHTNHKVQEGHHWVACEAQALEKNQRIRMLYKGPVANTSEPYAYADIICEKRNKAGALSYVRVRWLPGCYFESDNDKMRELTYFQTRELVQYYDLWVDKPVQLPVIQQYDVPTLQMSVIQSAPSSPQFGRDANPEHHSQSRGDQLPSNDLITCVGNNLMMPPQASDEVFDKELDDGAKFRTLHAGMMVAYRTRTETGQSEIRIGKVLNEPARFHNHLHIFEHQSCHKANTHLPRKYFPVWRADETKFIGNKPRILKKIRHQASSVNVHINDILPVTPFSLSKKKGNIPHHVLAEIGLVDNSLAYLHLNTQECHVNADAVHDKSVWTKDTCDMIAKQPSVALTWNPKTAHKTLGMWVIHTRDVITHEEPASLKAVNIMTSHSSVEEATTVPSDDDAASSHWSDIDDCLDDVCAIASAHTQPDDKHLPDVSRPVDHSFSRRVNGMSDDEVTAELHDILGDEDGCVYFAMCDMDVDPDDYIQQPSSEANDIPVGVVGTAKKVNIDLLTVSQKRWALDSYIRELNSMSDNKVYEQTLKHETGRQRPLRLKFVLDYKIIDGTLGIKGRLVAEGMKRFDFRENVDVTTGMPKPRALMTLFAYITQQDEYTEESVMSVDVKTAFLQSEMPVPILVRRPPVIPRRKFSDVPEYELDACEAKYEAMVAEMFGPDGLAYAVKALYGTRDAPRVWEKTFLKLMDKLKYVRSRCHPGVYIRYRHKPPLDSDCNDNIDTLTGLLTSREIECILYVHVDDIIALACPSARPFLCEIGQHIKLKAPPDVPNFALGFNMSITRDCITVSQQDHANDIPVDDVGGSSVWNTTSWHDARSIKLPLPGTLQKELNDIKIPEGEGELLSKRDHEIYRTKMGKSNWLRYTRFDILFALSYLARYLHAPDKRAARLLQHLCKYIKTTSSLGLIFPTKYGRAKGIKTTGFGGQAEKLGIDLGKGCQRWTVNVFSDASLGVTSQTGFIVLINDMVVVAESTKQRKRGTSSLKVETNAAQDSTDEHIMQLLFLTELLVEATPSIHFDALNLVQLINSFHPNPTEASLRPFIIKLQELIDGVNVDERAAVILDQGANILNEEIKAKMKQSKNECRYCFTSILALRGKLTDVVDYTGIPSQRITVKHISGDINPADALTKPMNVKGITDWMYDTKLGKPESVALVAQMTDKTHDTKPSYNSLTSFAKSMWLTIDQTLDRVDSYVSGTS